MDLAGWSRRLEWSLAAVVVVLHVGIFLWPERSGQPDFLISTAHDAQLYSAIVLILAWSVLGPGWVWLRGAALPILLVAWFLPWNTRMIPRETADSFPIAVGLGAAMLVVGLRCCGLKTLKAAWPGGREKGAQFSLLALLIATTLIAAAVGLLEWLRPTLGQSSNVFVNPFRGLLQADRGWFTPQLVRQLVMVAAVVMSAVGAIWVVLRPGAIWLRLAALVAIVGVFGAYQAHLSGVSSERFAEVAINLALGLAAVATLTAISVVPLRLLDFRLQRKAKVSQPVSSAAGKFPDIAANRSRLRARVAALVCLLVLVAGGIPIVQRVQRSHSQSLSPPSQAFARWVEPRRHLVIRRGSALRLTIIDFDWRSDLTTVDFADTVNPIVVIDKSQPDEPPSSFAPSQPTCEP